jgi:hypothetical protein
MTGNWTAATWDKLSHAAKKPSGKTARLKSRAESAHELGRDTLEMRDACIHDQCFLFQCYGIDSVVSYEFFLGVLLLLGMKDTGDYLD